MDSIQLKYGYEGYRQFPLTRAKVIPRGGAEGNKLGRGVMNTACIPNYPYFTCLIVPIQYIYARLFTLVEFFDHVNRKSDHTVLRLCHGSSAIFEEFLS